MLRVRALLLCLPLLNSASGNSWPVARFKNGTVGVQNEGGKVMINSNELHVVGELVVKGGYVLPPKCMPPGGDKLIYNGTRWFCVCVESWAGETCEMALSPPLPNPPPPSPPSSPAPSPPPSPPPLFLTPLVEDATQPKLYASDAASNDYFGSSVSLYGDTALIGAFFDVYYSGSVYVFTRSSADGTFTQQSKLYASDAASGDFFGSSVSLYGDTALIGAKDDNDNNELSSGSVYVFTRSSADGTFTQQSKIHANDAASDDSFGSSVSLYGDTALIGAIGDDDNNLSRSGSVYVFTRSSADGTFTQQSKIHASDAASIDSFGSSVSLYGDTALIGAYYDSDNNLYYSGSVYVFTRSSADGTFTQQSKIRASDAASGDRFGFSVSLYGDTALIGAYYDSDNNLSYSGSVYVFTRSSADGTFTQQSKLYASDAALGDRFGSSVSLYGDTALIGAYYDNGNNLSNSGSVYVFKAPL